MGTLVYADLLENGAPELPEGLFYAIRQYHDDYLFANNEVVRVSICERIDASPWKAWWWHNLPFRKNFMANPYERFIVGKNLPLIEEHPYETPSSIVHSAEDVPQAIADACTSLWNQIREAEEKAAAKRKAVQIAKTWVGDHP